MAFYPFHVSVAIITYVVFGGFTVLFGMFSLLIREKLYIGEAILAFLFGVIIGPYGANIFNPRRWGGGNDETVAAITLEITRVVLAVGVFAIGVELPSKYMKKHWKSLLFLVGPIMAVGWVICAGLIYALVPALDFLSSLAIAACLTPTDPILSAAVINGRYAEKHVPEHLRHLLSAESGCNDGAAFPFLFIALYLILEADDRVAVGEWFYITWVYEIILGTVIGILIGWGFRHLMKFCETRQLIDRHSYVAQYISLALLSNGVTALLGSDDLLAAFFSGVAFAWDSHFNKQTADSVFSAVIDLLFNVAIFVFIGAWMPFHSFNNPDVTISVWRLVVIGILVLLLRRLPIMLVLYKWIPDVRTFREAVFSGHFGPMGVGAIFIATLALEKLPHPHKPPQNQTDILALSIEPIIAFMVMCSILIHGLSIPFFNLGRRVHSITMTRTLSLRGHHEPEWAGMTMKATRPEDIVINRDPEIPPTGVITEKEMEEGRIPVTPSHSSEDTRKVAETEAVDQEDVAEVREWREGRHLVREHHTKPGEEVRVEVIRDAFESSGLRNLNAVKATFSVAEHAIREEVLRYLGTFSARQSLERSRSRNSTHKTITPSETKNKKEHEERDNPDVTEIITPIDNDDNEEWEDEPEDELASLGSDSKKRNRPPSPRSRRTSRSTSIRRNVSGGNTRLTHRRVTKEDTPPEIEIDRGTPPSPATPATPASPSRVPSGIGLSRTDSIASDSAGPISPRGVAFSRTDSIVSVGSNHRVARLRERETGDTPNVRSRDSSPSRNVRFAAELSRPTSRSGSPAPHRHHHHHSHSNSEVESPNPYATQRASVLKGPVRR
ncbi:hypothetical protein CPB86DRAFT_805957 [Serendipita vermifera]|nr:hypothetical protein CPB86DRAFT_805957 [Serendipita vermifera]